MRMDLYAVMLEGTHDGLGFLQTFNVVAKTPTQAVELARRHSGELGGNIVSCEEVERLRAVDPTATPQVVDALGRSFFPLDDV